MESKKRLKESLDKSESKDDDGRSIVSSQYSKTTISPPTISTRKKRMQEYDEKREKVYKQSIKSFSVGGGVPEVKRFRIMQVHKVFQALDVSSIGKLIDIVFVYYLDRCFI
mgnify:CR=1 FL=1